MDADLIAAAAEAEPPVVLVTVLQTRGSAPRHAGAKMLLRGGLPPLGTVGGGRIEAAALAAAADCARSGVSALLEARMLGDSALGEEMICGGSVLALVELVEDPGPYRAAADLLKSGRRALLAKRIGPDPGAGAGTGAAALALPPDAVSIRAATVRVEALGEDGLGAAGLDPEAVRRALSKGAFALADEGRLALDPVFPAEKLVILGAGHVGRALARLGTELGFAVTVVDDRAEMADPSRFPPGTRVVVSDYAAAAASLPFDASTYAVILTRGHAFDLEAARAVLGRERRYAGMIGSARKTRFVLDQLKAEGFGAAEVDALCAPIGLDIGAETPEEIAVSIMGEIVAFRRGARSLPALAASRESRRA